MERDATAGTALAVELAAMLRDIEDELACTSREIGKTAFDSRVMAALAAVPRERFVPISHRALADAARERLAALGYANVAVRHADGHVGWPEHAPYDGIVVTAATPEVPPALVTQLRPGGRLVVPVGLPDDIQQLRLIEKRADGSVASRDLLPVAFVPLTRELR